MIASPCWDTVVNWRKSSASAGNGECVEVACSESFVLVRDSRDRRGPVLALSRAEWDEVLGRIRHQEAGRGEVG